MMGLIGIVMITNPFGDALNIGSLYGLGSALAGAFLVVILRMLGRTEACHCCLWHNIAGVIIYPLGVLFYLKAMSCFQCSLIFPISAVAWLCCNFCANWIYFSLQAR